MHKLSKKNKKEKQRNRGNLSPPAITPFFSPIERGFTLQEMKFYIKDFFSKFEGNCRLCRI